MLEPRFLITCLPLVISITPVRLKKKNELQEVQMRAFGTGSHAVLLLLGIYVRMYVLVLHCCGTLQVVTTCDHHFFFRHSCLLLVLIARWPRFVPIERVA